MPTRSLRSRGYLCHTRHQSPLLDPRQVWGRLYQRRWEGSLEESRCGCKKSGEGGLRPCCSSPAQVCPAFQREAEGVPSCDCHTFRRRRGWRRRPDFRWSWKRTAWGAEGVADSHQGAHPRRWGWVSPCPARRGCCWWSSSRRYRLCSGKEASWSRDFTQPLSADPIDRGYKRFWYDTIGEEIELEERPGLSSAGTSRAGYFTRGQGSSRQEKGQGEGLAASSAGGTSEGERGVQEKEKEEGSPPQAASRGGQSRPRSPRWLRLERVLQLKQPGRGPQEGQKRQRFGVKLRAPTAQARHARAGISNGDVGQACPATDGWAA